MSQQIVPTQHILKDELSPEDMREQLLSKGFLRVNNLHFQQSDFMDISERLGQNFISEGLAEGQYRSVGASGRRQVLHRSESVFSAPGRYFELPLHGECYFEQRHPPPLLWFYCESGEGDYQSTTLCDGIALFERLNAEDQALFLNHPLCYERYHSADFWRTQYLVETPAALEDYLRSQDREWEWLENQGIKTRFTAPAVHMRKGVPVFINSFLPFGLRQLRRPEETRARVSFADGTPLDEALLLRVEAVAEGLTRRIDWKKGDIFVVDNTRMMHGREALSTEDPRKLQVRLSGCDVLEAFAP